MVAGLMKRMAEERALILAHREGRFSLARFRGTASTALCDFITSSVKRCGGILAWAEETRHPSRS